LPVGQASQLATDDGGFGSHGQRLADDNVHLDRALGLSVPSRAVGRAVIDRKNYRGLALLDLAEETLLQEFQLLLADGHRQELPPLQKAGRPGHAVFPLFWLIRVGQRQG